MSILSRKGQLAAVLLLPILVVGCASKAPTFGDNILEESGQIGAIGKEWKKGTAMVTKGKKLIAQGKEQLADGRENIADGESMVDEGKELIEKAEKEYQQRQQKLAM